ncbi:sensor histidine kinase [Nocardioides marinquilinus]|uniref:histidine kinase n=1 Tax=Nocardioides marinquilinus TaxID=1210400 RepID=A0ABP9P9G2_9ACTN
MSETLVLPVTEPDPHAPPGPDAPATATSPRPSGPGLLARLGRDTAYVLSGFPLAVLAFVAVVTGLALGAGLLVVWVGLAVLAGSVLLARGLAHVERARLARLLGRGAPSPSYLVAGRDAGRVRRVLTPLRDPQSWLDSLWSLVGFVTGTAAFCVVVAWWAGALGGLTYWFWQQWLPDDNEGLAELMGWGDGRAAESLLNLGLGVLALLTLPLAVRVSAAVHAGTADALLCSRARLQTEVRRVSDSRSAARLAEADALRRLERDIHDGPQQRLVRLGIDLGRAKRQLDDDPVRAGAILDDALRQAQETVAELRALSRGIAPPLLVDRGLRAALDELLQRAAVPTAAHVDVPDRLPPHVETTVYFVVAEALTNIAKHSGASRAALAVTCDTGWVAVVVQDDGLGGAHLAKGSGLAGLRQRLAGVDGVLEVDSPDGGPTVVGASIPLGADAPDSPDSAA